MSAEVPYQQSSLHESFVAQAHGLAESTPPATPTKTPHTAQTSHFFSPTSTPRALFPQAHAANQPATGDVAQMHAIMQLQAQMLVRPFFSVFVFFFVVFG